MKISQVFAESGSIRRWFQAGIGLIIASGGIVLPLKAIATENAIASPTEIVAELNRARQSPAAYAAWLETFRPYYDQAALRVPGEMGVRTIEGVYALDHAIAQLAQQQPLTPLRLELGLVQATQDHLTELLAYNRFTLSGVNGSTPMERAEQYGTVAAGGRLVEVLSQGFTRAEVIVASLIIDDGSLNRSTRTLILNPEMTAVGTECGVNSRDMPLCVFDYATTYDTLSPTGTQSSAIAPSAAAQVLAPPQVSPSEVSNRLPQSPESSASSPTSPSSVPSTLTNPSPSKSNRLTTSSRRDVSRNDSLTPTYAAAGDTTWSGYVSDTQLSGLAADLIDETNALRANPAVYAERLIRLRPYYEGTLVRIPGQPIVEVVEGVAALDEAIAVLLNTPPVSALNLSHGLAQGAADHAEDLGVNDATGHYGSDHSDPFERINRYGIWDQMPGDSAAENISYGPPTLAEWHMIQLLVDDNVPSRSHRQALLNPNYRDVGSACHSHPTFRIACVMTYASDYEDTSL